MLRATEPTLSAVRGAIGQHGSVSLVHPLTPLEIASGLPLGCDSAVAGGDLVDGCVGARVALEEAVRRGLERGPYLVSFSGGRDSSALLALAAHIAQREGLAAPIAHTLRFERVADADEAGWQERVIAHLGVEEWVREEVDAELGFLGPVARPLLEAHGVLFPSNACAVVPACRAAAGGTVVMGVDGDGLFGGWGWQRAANVLARRVPWWRGPGLSARMGSLATTGRVVGLAWAPAAVQRWWLRRAERIELPWLMPAARAAVIRAWAAERADEPATWPARTGWYRRRRYLALGRHAFDQVEASTGATLDFPLLDPAFLGAVGRDGGRFGYGSRTLALRVLVGDLLPDEVLTRSSKAVFTSAFWTEETRAFCRAWEPASTADGLSLIDPSIVDVGALQSLWRADAVPQSTEYLAQAAWLASRTTAGPPDPPEGFDPLLT